MTALAPVLRPARADHVLLLDEDPDLGQDLSARDHDTFRKVLVARTIDLEGPAWEPVGIDPARTLGFLVLDGLLGRRVCVHDVASIELLGCGDIVAAAGDPPPWSPLAPEVSWKVFHRARVAVLDERITRIVSTRPELVVAFSRRALRRTEAGACLSAIGHFPRAEDRVALALFHIAASWGRVTPRGVRIPFRLTHEVLGEIVGAQRPTVTLGLGVLRRRGEVIREEDGCYVLTSRAMLLGGEGAISGTRSSRSGRRR